MTEHVRPFRLEIRLRDRLIGSHLIDDPFHCTTIVVGWQDLLRALLKGSLRLRVDLYAGHWLATRRTMQAIQSWHEEGWPEEAARSAELALVTDSQTGELA